MSLQSTDLFVVQRGNSIYKVTADNVAPNKKVTTVDVELIGEDPATGLNPFSPEFFGATQQDANWFLYNRTLETSNVSVGPNPPTSQTNGDLWWSTLEGNLFIWYNDGDSAQWVDASPAFLEINYERLEDYLDQAVLDNAVSQIVPSGIVTVDPPAGKGVVTVGVDTTTIDTNISNLDSKLDQEIIDRQDADSSLQDNIDLKVNITDFETDQQRQDDFIAEDQQRQDDEIERLENIIKDLADRLDQLEDQIAGLATIDGGYPNAEGVFDEPETDGGTSNPDSQTPPDIGGGNAEGYD